MSPVSPVSSQRRPKAVKNGLPSTALPGPLSLDVVGRVSEGDGETASSVQGVGLRVVGGVVYRPSVCPF